MMTRLLDGLLLHDILLMVLGAMLFLVLLGGLVIRLVRNQPVNRGMQWFFVLPALMIAYPGTQRLAFSKGLIELEKRTETVIQNPGDTTQLQALEEQLLVVEKRPLRSIEALEITAKAHYLNGNLDEAASRAGEIMRREPKNQTGSALVQLVTHDQLSGDVPFHPADSLRAERFLRVIDAR